MKARITMILIAFGMLLAGCGTEEPIQRELFAMDTYITLQAYGAEAEAALDEAEAELKRLDHLLAAEQETSEIAELNISGRAQLSEDSAYLLARSMDFYEMTDGVFDIAIYPIKQAWGFSDQNHRVPAEDEIASLLPLTDASKIRVSEDGASVSFDQAGMAIDLGGMLVVHKEACQSIRDSTPRFFHVSHFTTDVDVYGYSGKGNAYVGGMYSMDNRATTVNAYTLGNTTAGSGNNNRSYAGGFAGQAGGYYYNVYTHGDVKSEKTTNFVGSFSGNFAGIAVGRGAYFNRDARQEIAGAAVEEIKAHGRIVNDDPESVQFTAKSAQEIASEEFVTVLNGNIAKTETEIAKITELSGTVTDLTSMVYYEGDGSDLFRWVIEGDHAAFGKKEEQTIDKSALDAAIKDAEDAMKGIATSNADKGSDLAAGTTYTTTAEKKALTDAIAAANRIRNDEQATQEEVDGAVTALKQAQAAYEKAKKKSSKPAEDQDNKKDKPAPAVQKQAMYRLYNPNSGEHFYTASVGERNYLDEIGWNYEGIGWNAPKKSNTPVYRLYNPNAGDHHYTTSKAERDWLVSLGWNDEGIGWYSDDAKSVPIYRQYNPNAQTGAHNFTASLGENDYLASIGWNAEGIGWYAA